MSFRTDTFLDVTTVEQPDGRVVTLVVLAGDHDVASTGRLRAAVDAAPATGAVVVDLAQCSFVDSSVLGTLLRAAATRSAFAVVLPSDPTCIVVRAIDILGVRSHLRCRATRASALAAVRRSRPSPGGVAVSDPRAVAGATL